MAHLGFKGLVAASAQVRASKKRLRDTTPKWRTTGSMGNAIQATVGFTWVFAVATRIINGTSNAKSSRYQCGGWIA